MIIGIEGTGSQSWDNSDLQRSFVRRVLNQTTMRPRYYLIGPSTSGDDGDAIIKGACKLVMNNNDPITLVGYSRGAAYCMEICARLLRWRTWRSSPTVEMLILFDAVARQGDIDLPEKVPENVKTCFHAHRNPMAGSRYWFQNVGLVPASPSATKFEKKMFFGSHGALGGVYYDAIKDENIYDSNDLGNTVVGSDDRNLANVPRTPQTNLGQDRAASHAAATWMWPRLMANGVLPSGANQLVNAPPFSGSRTGGQVNPIQ